MKNLRSDRCGVCGGPPTECPCPEHWASVEVWWLGKFVGRKIWTRPDGLPSNTIPQWVELLDVWQERNSYGDIRIIAYIDWRGIPSHSVFLTTNRVVLELAPEEAKHVRVTELGGGCRSTTYDPWGSTSPPALEHREPSSRDTPVAPAYPQVPDPVESAAGPQFVLFDL